MSAGSPCFYLVKQHCLRVVFKDDLFRDMYPILNQHRMGIDIFKSSTVIVEGMRRLKDELKQDCGIAIGMARRLVKNFQSWHKTLPLSTRRLAIPIAIPQSCFNSSFNPLILSTVTVDDLKISMPMRC